MTTFLTDLDPTTARGLILLLTLGCETLRGEIIRERAEKMRDAKIARFRRLNDRRVRLIEEHGLETWVATLFGSGGGRGAPRRPPPSRCRVEPAPRLAARILSIGRAADEGHTDESGGTADVHLQDELGAAELGGCGG